MALLYIDGFDHYATADVPKKYALTSGTPVIAAGAGRRGGGALSMNGQYVARQFSGGLATVIVGFAFARLANGASTSTFLHLSESATRPHLSFVLTAANVIMVTCAEYNGAVLATGTTALALGAYNYIEVKAVIHDTAGAVTVRINGAVEIALTGVDTRNGGTGLMNMVLVGTDFSSVACYYDDLYICDATGSTNNDFLGDCRVDTLYPSADGTYGAMACSTGTTHCTLVDEATPNTTDYVSSATVNAKDSYAFTDLPSLPGTLTVFGVQVSNASLKDDAGARSVANLVRSGSTDAQSATVALGTTLQFNVSMHPTDPATGTAWTTSGVNAMQAGTVVAA